MLRQEQYLNLVSSPDKDQFCTLPKYISFLSREPQKDGLQWVILSTGIGLKTPSPIQFLKNESAKEVCCFRKYGRRESYQLTTMSRLCLQLKPRDQRCGRYLVSCGPQIQRMKDCFVSILVDLHNQRTSLIRQLWRSSELNIVNERDRGDSSPPLDIIG